jgi:hypothetical protein
MKMSDIKECVKCRGLSNAQDEGAWSEHGASIEAALEELGWTKRGEAVPSLLISISVLVAYLQMVCFFMPISML